MVDLPTVETSTVSSSTTRPLEKAMIAFEVNDMTCGHCVSTITKALKATDKDAKVEIDLATHRVQIDAASADAEELAEAIKDAGYTPVPVQAGPVSSSKPAGSCCGGCH
jgi:copper chaperone